MKKTIAIVALAIGAASTQAQDLTSKKGEPILPEAGDWSIGVDATPFLEYMGNFFGKTTKNNAPVFDFNNYNQTITGKYFVDVTTAYRASLRIGSVSNTTRNNVADRSYVPPAAPPNGYPAIDPEKTNTWKNSQSNFGLALGLEKRKGKTRLQGFYGGELGFNFSSSKDVFTYGNSLKPADPNAPADPVVDVDPTDDNFTGAGNIVTLNTAGSPDGRILERKNGATISFGIRGFIGCEYFILPKISLGGEFGWGIGFANTGASKATAESIGNDGVAGSNDSVGKSDLKGTRSNDFVIDTDNLNSIFGPTGQIRLNFHF